MNQDLNKGYWHSGWPIPAEDTDLRKIEVRAIVSHAHRLRSRFMARVLRRWGRAVLVLPAVLLSALGRYGRFVAQPWRMSGSRVAQGNRR